MDTPIIFNGIDYMKLARSIEKDCQEGIKWEIRKLEWIREEKRKNAEKASLHALGRSGPGLGRADLLDLP